MTEPAEGRLAGQHRRARGSRLVGLLVSLALVVIAAAGVYVTLHWRGEGTRPPAQGASSASHHPSASATHPSASASPSSTPSLAAASSTARTRRIIGGQRAGDVDGPSDATRSQQLAGRADHTRRTCPQDSGRHPQRHPHQRPGCEGGEDVDVGRLDGALDGQLRAHRDPDDGVLPARPAGIRAAARHPISQDPQGIGGPVGSGRWPPHPRARARLGLAAKVG